MYVGTSKVVVVFGSRLEVVVIINLSRYVSMGTLPTFGGAYSHFLSSSNSRHQLRNRRVKVNRRNDIIFDQLKL
jgi:hypothetical protein